MLFRSRRDVKPGPLPRLTGLTPEALDQRLGSANGPLRDLAHRELLDLPDAAWRRASTAVKALASTGASPAVRAQALSLLAGKGDLPTTVLEYAPSLPPRAPPTSVSSMTLPELAHSPRSTVSGSMLTAHTVLRHCAPGVSGTCLMASS